MRYSYRYDDYDDDVQTFSVIDAKRGQDYIIACTDQRDDAELIVKALNAVYDGPFALDAIPNCVVREIA
jgi:hypothetical protein